VTQIHSRYESEIVDFTEWPNNSRIGVQNRVDGRAIELAMSIELSSTTSAQQLPGMVGNRG
jgi:hypothetical protein